MSRLGHHAIAGFALALVLFAFAPEAEAATTVPGQTITADTTWTLAGSPYTVTGNVHVAGAAGPRLTIEPGVEVRFTSSGRLQVGDWWSPGALSANGTAAQPILLTSASATPARGAWQNVRFESTGNTRSFLQNVTVEWAGSGSRTAVEVANGRVEVANLTVRESAWAGVYLDNVAATLADVTLVDNARWGLYAEADASPTLRDVLVRNTSAGAPLRVRLDQALDGVTLAGNPLARVEHWGVDLWSNRTLPAMHDADTSARYAHQVLNSFGIRGGAAWTVPAGATVLFNDGISVSTGDYGQKGSIVAEGTEAEPIALLGASGTAANGWYGLYFRGDGGAAPGQSVLRNVTLAHSRDDGIETYAYSGLTLDNVTLRNHNARGLHVSSSAPTLRNVFVRDTGYEGAYLSTTGLAWRGGHILNAGRSGVYVAGCGTPTLVDVAIENTSSYGVYADGTCNGAHLDGVSFSNVSNRPFRNRIDVRHEVSFPGRLGVDEVEYWGGYVESNRTLPIYVNATGAPMASVLVSDVRVRNGATLTLPPGTRLLGEHGVRIHVGDYAQRGSLVAEGTEAEPIVMTSRSGSRTNGWDGLYFRADNAPGGFASVIRNATVSFSRYEGVESYAYSPLHLDNVTVRGAGQRGVMMHYANPTFRNVVSTDNGWEGLMYHGSNPVWRGGIINGSGRSGVYAAGCGFATLDGVTVSNSSGYGVWSNDACAGVHFDGVDIVKSGGRAFRNRLDARYDVSFAQAAVDEVEYWGNDLYANLTVPIRSNGGNETTTVILSGFEVRNGATLTFPAGSRVLFADWAYVNVGTYAQLGSLVAEGTVERPVTFLARSGAVNGWYGLHFRGDATPAGASSVLRNATVAHSRDDAVHAYYYSALTLDNVTLHDNARYGLALDGSSPRLRNVDVLRSGYEGAYFGSSSPAWRGGRIADSARSGIYTGGCGVAVLEDVRIENSRGNGHYADGACNGIHYDGVRIANATGRPWRNRIDLRQDVTVENVSVKEVEYWGVDLVANRTLVHVEDAATGARYDPVIVSGFEVRNGAVLTFPAGSRVLFAEWAYVNVGTYAQKGGLVAEGTEAEPVRILGRSGTPASGAWYGLYFRGDGNAPRGESVLRNATIAFSRDDALEFYHYPGAVLDNLTLDHNARYGARLDGPAPVIRNVDVSRSGWESVLVAWSSPVWEGGRLNHSGRSGIYSTGCGLATFRDVVVDTPNGYGYYADGSCNGANLDGVTFLNVSRAYRSRIDGREDVTIVNASVHEVELWGAEILNNRTLALKHDEADGARLTHVVLSGGEVRNGATLTIPAGATVLFGDGAHLNVGTYGQKGSLKAEGTEAEPIQFLSRSGSSSGGWYGLYFRGDGNAPLGESVLRNVTIAHSRDDAVYVHAYNGLLLDNATLRDNARHGVVVDGASPALVNVSVLRSGSDGAWMHYASPSWRGGRIERAGRHGVLSSGCGVATLQGVTIDAPAGYGHYADGSCNGAHYDDVRVVNVGPGGRAWRNRMDVRHDATVENVSILQVEYWGGDVTANKTLAKPVNGTGGAVLATVLLQTFDVRNGATLTIPPGSRILGASGVDLTVGTCAQAGSLRAEGTVAEPITMGALSGSLANAWSALFFRGDCNAPPASSVLRNVTVTHSNNHGVHAHHYGDLLLDNVTVTDSAQQGFVLHGNAPGTPTLVNAVARRNAGNGVWVEYEGADIRGGNFSDNGANGVELRNTAGVTLRGATMFNNSRSGVNVTWNPGNLDARGNVFWRNGGFGVDLQSGVGNVVVDNAFIENVAAQARATGLNTWNVTKTEGRNIAYGPYLGGNSWSDYGGEDTDGDGLGDTLTPYAANLGPGRDWLPVMGNLYADFNVTIPDVDDLPRRLVLRDASRGGFSAVDQWQWDLGDGAQAVTRDVTHDFAADGNYSVRLVVANPHGQLSGITKNVVVDSVDPVSAALVDGTLGQNAWYVSGVNVTLSAADDRAGVQALRYRLDNGSWTAYTARIPVLADGAHVLEYHATDRNGNVEPVRYVTFRIDRTAPFTPDATLNGTLGRDGWYVGDVLATLSALDNASGLARIEYAWDATPSTTYAGPVTLADDGAFLLRYRAVDNAGNVGREKNVTVRRDATLPEVAGHESGPLGGNGWYLGATNVTLNASDATSGVRHLNASVDGGAWFEVNGTIVIEGHGIHVLNVTATDGAGNLLAEPPRLVRIDLTPPVSEHRFDGTLGANGWFVTEVNVTFSGNDTGSGVGAFTYSLDDGPLTAYDGPVRVAQNGQHRLVYHATDLAGNVENVHEVILYLDLEAPTTSLNVTGPAGANGWWLGNVTASLEAEDGASLAQILYQVNGGPESEFLAPFGIAGEGVHNVTYHGVSLGGLEEEEKSTLVRIDLANPTLTVNFSGAAGANGWFVGAVNATLLAADAASGIATTLVSLDGAAETTYTGPATFATTGVHTVAGRTLDVSGRVGALAAVNVSVDLTDPLTTLTTSPATPDGANGWFTTPVAASLAATDVGAGLDRILLSVDGGAETPYTGPVTLGEGVHTLAYRAVDLAGRVETLRTTTVKVDLTAPSLANATSGALGHAGWFVSGVNLTLSADDATSGVANLSYRLNGGAWTPVNGTLALLTTGVHDVTLRAVDLAGLVSVANLTVKVDVSAPVTTLTVGGAPNGFGWRATSPTVTLAASDLGSGVAALRYALDGGPLQAYAGPFALPEGFHNLTVQAEDAAGLLEALRAATPVKVDLTDPVVTGVAHRAPDTPSGWHLAPVTVNFTGTDAPSGLRDFRVWLNATDKGATSGSFTLNEEGLRTLRVAARDYADRLLSPTLDTAFRLDLTPPTSSHALAPGHVATSRGVRWHTSDVTLSVSASDLGSGVASRLVALDGAEQPYAGPLVLTADGVYNVTYRAIDNVGRNETTRTVPTFGIDRTPPVTLALTDVAPDVDGVYKTEVNVTLSATDALSGVLDGATGLEWRHAGGAFTRYVAPIHLNVSGDYAIEFRARDVAGNVEGIKTLDVSLFVDTTPPVVDATPLRAAGPGGWFDGDVTVRLDATDLQSSVLAVLYRIDGGDLVNVLGATANVTLSGEGVRTLEYFATDIAGNNATFRTLEVGIDTTPPTLDVLANFTEGRDGWVVSPVNLTPLPGDALSGVHHVEASVDNGTWTPVDVLTLAQSGNRTARIRAVDAAGLLSDVHAWSGKLDLDTPALRHSFSGPLGLDGWYRENVSVLLVGAPEKPGVPDTSGILPVRYRFDGGEWTQYPGHAILFTEEGNHTLEALVEDVAGNLARLGPLNVGLDRTRPTLATAVEGVRGENGWWVSGVRLETTLVDEPGVAGANVSGVHNLTRRVDDGPNATLARPALFDLAVPGNHTVRDFALDRALNGVAAALALPIDTDDPLLNVTVAGPAGENTWFRGPVRVNATSLDATSGPSPARLTREGVVSNVTGPILLEAEGVHRLALRARDLAGRLGNETQLDVRIDATPPDLAALADGPRGADGWFVGATRVTLDARDLVSGLHEIRYAVNDEAPRVYRGAFNLTESGRYVINYTAGDLAGNVAVREMVLHLDVDAPEANVTVAGQRAPDSEWFTSGVTIALDATDPTSGVARLEYTFDLNASWIPYTGPVTLSTEGVHRLHYRAVDESGKPSLVYFHDIRIDASSPLASLRLENTLYTEVDGRVYVSGEFCIEVTGIDAVSGVKSAVLRLAGSVTKLIELDLTVALHCFEPPETAGWHLVITYEPCDFAGFCSGDDMSLDDVGDGGAGGGGAGMYVARPFRGALNLQKASLPVFAAACPWKPEGVEYDTGIKQDVTDPDDPSRTREIHVKPRNPHHPACDTTVVAGTRVPVWVMGYMFNPQEAEVLVDGKLVGRANRSEEVKYETFAVRASVTPDGAVQHELVRGNVTRRVFAFELDTLNLTAGDHVLSLKGVDRRGRTVGGLAAFTVTSVAAGGHAVDLAENATADGAVPGSAPAELPKALRDLLPTDITPDLPPEMRDRLDRSYRAARIVMDLLDTLYLDNYAYVDETMLRFYETYEAADAGFKETTGRPDPLTVGEIVWAADAPEPDQVIPEGGL